MSFGNSSITLLQRRREIEDCTGITCERAGEQSLRIKLPESFPSDPLSSRSDNESRAANLSLLAKPARFPLPSRSRPSSSPSRSPLLRLRLSSFLQPKANIPADNAEDPIVQTAPALYIGLAGKMKYAAKRHVQSVRQVVRQIKHDSPTLTDL